MKAILLTVLVIGVVSAQRLQPWRVPDEKAMPHALAERAKFIINMAETELIRHFAEGRHHLAHRFEAEIESLRLLVRELEALDQTKHVELHHLHEVEERLFRHENRIVEEGLWIANMHDEEEHRRNPDHHKDLEHERVLPHFLAERARVIIQGAEYELNKHWTNGLKHLTHGMEKEIETVKELEKELLALEKERHLELHKLHEFESRLVHHENRLAEEAFFVLNRHREEEVKREHHGGFYRH